jgi:hypothetical protein
MIIGACGFVATGSSAITDLLREYDSTWVYDKKEFDIVHNPDGIEDLEYQLTVHSTKYTSSVVAFERFRRAAYFLLSKGTTMKNDALKIDTLIDEYIDSLVQVRWNGMGAVDRQLYSGRIYKNIYCNMPLYKIKKHLYKMRGKGINDNSGWPLHRYEFSIYPNDFIEKTNYFIHQLLKILGGDFSKKIVLDQPFAGNNPQRSFKYFGDECKAIIVDRDPRDCYISAKLQRKKTTDGFQIPVSNVEDYVKYYRRLRDNKAYRGESKNVIKINLADLIYEYDDTVKKIEKFCGISDHVRKKSVFDPSISIANTQLYKKYKGYEKSIEYIENNLSEYLYPYDKYGNVDTSGKIFFNESPLNIEK